MTQYFDTLKDIGVSSGSKVILTPHAPGVMTDIASQLRSAIITGNEATLGDPELRPEGNRGTVASVPRTRAQ
jgi:hypothetical protein